MNKTQRSDGILDFYREFDIRYKMTAELSAVLFGRTLPKWKLLGTYFCLEAEWNSGLLNMVVRKRSLEHFQEPYSESNVELVNYTLVNERTNADFSHHASA